MQIDKYVFELTTPKHQKINVLISAKDEGEAEVLMQKIHQSIFGIRNDRFTPVNLDYLFYCQGIQGSTDDRFEQWGKTIDAASSKLLIKEFSAHNEFIGRMQSRPVRTVLKGAFVAPFSAPKIMYRSMGRDLYETGKMLSGLIPQGTQKFKQAMFNRSVNAIKFEGEDLPITLKAREAKFSLSRLLIFTSLAILFYALFFSPIIPSLIGISLLLSAKFLTVYAIREVILFIGSRKNKDVDNGK